MLVLYPRPESFIGKEFDGYRIDSVLGTGGMGIVFKATQLELERQVALKVINPSLAHDEAFWSKFKSEAHALAKIHHPNIVVIYNFRPSEHGFYIAMEFVSGVTLAEHIRQKGRVKWPECILLARQILSALQSTHKAGIIHRDIKPSNILVNDNNFVKITDFGLAKMQKGLYNPDDSTVTLDTAGTLCYMPPEQIRGLHSIDHRGDIYSVGITLYEALTGRLPFEKEASGYEIQKSIVEKPFTPIKKIAVETPRPLARIIMKAIEKEPHKRFQSAQEMIKALEECEPGHQTPQKTYSFPTSNFTSPATAPKISAPRPLVFPVVLFILIGIVILSFTPLSVSNLFSGSTKQRTLAEQIQQNAAVLSSNSYTESEDRNSSKSEETAPDSLSRFTLPGVASAETIPETRPSTQVQQSAEAEANQRPSYLSEPVQRSTNRRRPPAATGSVRVISSPAGAEVLLNGTLVGRTPLFLDEIPAGPVDVEIRKDHHEPKTISKSVSPLAITFIDGELEPIQGFLRLEMTPPSDIYLNGEKLNLTPVAIFEQKILAKAHELSISHPSFGDWNRSIKIAPGDTSMFSVNFLKEIKVAVTAFDEAEKGMRAEILLDNKKTGKYTPAQLSITPGMHVISVQLDGYSVSEEPVLKNYESSTTSPLRFTLEKKP